MKEHLFNGKCLQNTWTVSDLNHFRRNYKDSTEMVTSRIFYYFNTTSWVRPYMCFVLVEESFLNSYTDMISDFKYNWMEHESHSPWTRIMEQGPPICIPVLLAAVHISIFLFLFLSLFPLSLSLSFSVLHNNKCDD